VVSRFPDNVPNRASRKSLAATSLAERSQACFIKDCERPAGLADLGSAVAKPVPSNGVRVIFIHRKKKKIIPYDQAFSWMEPSLPELGGDLAEPDPAGLVY